MWKEGGCFPSLQTGTVVFKTNKPPKPHEAHFNLFKWLFSERKRKKKQPGNMFGTMSWQEGEWPQPVQMESVPSLGSKAAAPWRAWEGEMPPLGDEPQKSPQREETPQTDAWDRNFMVQKGSGEGGSSRIKRDIGGISLTPKLGWWMGGHW